MTPAMKKVRTTANKLNLEYNMTIYKEEGFSLYGEEWYENGKLTNSRLLAKDTTYRLLTTKGGYWTFEIPENNNTIEEAYKLLDRLTTIYVQHSVIKYDIDMLQMLIDNSLDEK